MATRIQPRASTIVLGAALKNLAVAPLNGALPRRSASETARLGQPMRRLEEISSFVDGSHAPDLKPKRPVSDLGLHPDTIPRR